MLRLSYGDLQDCRLQDATHHYGDYSGYRFRGKVTWFADDLYTKVVHGGQGSNYTIAQIIKESSLIHIFWCMQQMIDENFSLMGCTYAHAGPDMRETFKLVLKQLEAQKAHEKNPNGQMTKYTLEDMIDKGQKDMEMGISRAVNEMEDLNDTLRREVLDVEPEDILLEIWIECYKTDSVQVYGTFSFEDDKLAFGRRGHSRLRATPNKAQELK